MKHPITIEKYNGTIKELARDIANLRYDSLEEFLKWLNYEIYVDSEKDKQRGKIQLGKLLRNCSDNISESRLHIIHAWKICKKYMEEK